MMKREDWFFLAALAALVVCIAVTAARQLGALA